MRPGMAGQGTTGVGCGGCFSPACSTGRPHTCGTGRSKGRLPTRLTPAAPSRVLHPFPGLPPSYRTTLCRIFLSSWSRHTAKGQQLEPMICTLSTLICDVLIWKQSPRKPAIAAPEPLAMVTPTAALRG